MCVCVGGVGGVGEVKAEYSRSNSGSHQLLFVCHGLQDQPSGLACMYVCMVVMMVVKQKAGAG